MPGVVPHRFLIRTMLVCPYVQKMPNLNEGDSLIDLPESARIGNLSELDEGKNFAELRLAWNDFGLGMQCIVRGKEQDPQGDADRPRQSDGLTLWLDTRDARSSHRASRFCHQFHFLPRGGGEDKEDPVAFSTKINRALMDAPLVKADEISFACHSMKGGYRMEAFLPAATLTGFDPEQHRRWGVYYAIRDQELGDQFLSVNADFPFSDDPSLWSVLELAAK